MAQKARYYTAPELHSFVNACKLIGAHLYSISNPSIIVPLRGSFLPTFLAGLGRREASGTVLHFMPETGFLHKTRDISRLYLRKYFEGHVKYLRGKKVANGPDDPFGFINVAMVDEAKSGNAISTRVHPYPQIVLEQLRKEDARSKLDKITKTVGLADRRRLIERELGNLERLLQGGYEKEHGVFSEISQKAGRGSLQLVTERGDYTPEAVFLLNALKKAGLASANEVEELTLHRWLVEAKLGLVARTGREHIAKVVHHSELMARKIGAQLKTRFEKPEDLLADFPRLQPYFQTDFEKLRATGLVEFEEHVSPPNYHSKYASQYAAAYATVANYRLNRFQELLSKAGGNTLAEKVRELANFHNGIHLDRMDELQRLWERNQQSDLAGDADELEKILQRASDYNRFKVQIIAVHGINYPAYVGKYFALKDAGEVVEVPADRIITMDNPLSSIEYARVGRHATHEFKFEPNKDMKQMLEDVAPLYAGTKPSRELKKYTLKLQHHFRKYVRKAVLQYVRELRRLEG